MCNKNHAKKTGARGSRWSLWDLGGISRFCHGPPLRNCWYGYRTYGVFCEFHTVFESGISCVQLFSYPSPNSVHPFLLPSLLHEPPRYRTWLALCARARKSEPYAQFRMFAQTRMGMRTAIHHVRTGWCIGWGVCAYFTKKDFKFL